MNNRILAKYPLPLKIAGVGRYLPKRIVPSSEIEARCGLPEGWSERKQGIRERRWVEDETVTLMGAEAAREAVTNAGISLTDIDLIFNVSNSYDRVIPDQSAQIQLKLGLGNSGVPCISVNSGCLSFIAALDMSAALLAVGRYRNILIVSALVSSVGVDYNNPNVCTMLGDGAAAVVVTRTPEGEPSSVHAAHMETYSLEAEVTGFTGKSNLKTMFSKEIASDEITFNFDPPALQAAGVKYNQKFMSKLWPANHDMIKLVIPNQATRLVIDMMKLAFPGDRVVGVVDHFGNIGAVGYPMALYEALAQKRISRGDLVLLHGIGAGFSLCGLVLTY